MEKALKVFRIGEGEPALVGYLQRGGSFSYAPEYLEDPSSQQVSYSLPLKEGAYTRQEALPYFEGLVPEGNPRRLMAAELHVREDDYVSMLACCGLDCVGDLALVEDELPLPPAYEPLEPDELALALEKPERIAELNGASRLSLAGTQAKVGLAHRPGASLSEGWLRPKNGGASTHILKVSSRDEISYFEYLCMRAAELCGLRVAQTALLDMHSPVICSTRFDRELVERGDVIRVVRRHQEDFTQAFGYSSGSKYAELEGGTVHAVARFVQKVAERPIEDLDELARLACFNYLIGNCDNHLKNISLLYSVDWSEIRLAPAYDLVCTTWFPDLTRQMGMAIGGVRNIDEVAVEDIRALSGEMGVPAKRLSAICHGLAEQIQDAVYKVSSEAPVLLDEVSWKADGLLEDLAPRREVLARV